MINPNQLYLFKERRFLPIFLVQFFGCLNDSILKNALIILVFFKLLEGSSAQFLVLLAHALFVLPFIIFASIAGQIADKYERSTLVKGIKLFEILIILAALYGFAKDDLYILFTLVGLMGIHSAFFGPIKYSLLPDHIPKDELLSANGFVEAGTFISILIGTIIGGLYTTIPIFVLIVMLVLSGAGFIASLFLPRSNNSNPDISVNLNIIAETANIVKYAYSKRTVYMAILGISWFWFLGAVVLAQIASLTKDILGADESVANLFLAVFSIGVGTGSFLCSKIFKNTITTKYIFLSALGISIFGADLFFASRISAIHYQPVHLESLWMFLSQSHHWRIVVDLFCLAAMGGLYIVPLFTIMQYFAHPAHRSRIIAASNLISAIFMVAASAILSVLLYFRLTVPTIILLVSLSNVAVAFYIYRLLPETRTLPIRVFKELSKLILNFLFRIEIKGIENYHNAGKKTIIIANHLSYMDPALLFLYIPETILFAVNYVIAKQQWAQKYLRFANTINIDPNNPIALKTLITEVNKNTKLVIFPEGRISTTGSLMKIYPGAGLIADKTGATILPIRIDGPQFSYFSKTPNIKKQLFPKITITILPPVEIAPPENLDSKQRRNYITQIIQNIMVDMAFESANHNQSLFKSILDAAKKYGSSKIIAQDLDNDGTNYKNFITKVFVLANLIKGEQQKNFKKSELQDERIKSMGRQLNSEIKTDHRSVSNYVRNENLAISEEQLPPHRLYVGVMLPSTTATAITFYAMQVAGAIPTMINFTSGVANIVSSCHTTGVCVIYTSRAFIEKAALQNLVDQLQQNNIEVRFLEDLKTKLTLPMKLKILFGSLFPDFYYNMLCKNQNPEDPAVALFTSGTEGKPKAVILSHRNIAANVAQVIAKVDLAANDIALNALPMFHCFGLTGAILALSTGMKSVFYPSPLHYKVIPEIIYDFEITVMFSTDTFINGYAANAHPYDFHKLRYVFAGAEKLKQRTINLFLEKYGIRVFEGYGVTEAAPVIAVNTPMQNKIGTVGTLMPKLEYVIKAQEGIKEGGRLCIKGPNVMMGYMKAEAPGVIVPPEVDELGKGWYDTGDIVTDDEDGYITILGRVKRFAKIGGEMVSLAAIEEIVYKFDSEYMHAATSIADNNKGEWIMLLTTNPNTQREQISKYFKESGFPELYIPKAVFYIEELPVLPTGKINYVKLGEIASSIISKE